MNKSNFLHVCGLTEQPNNEHEFAWLKYLQQLGNEVVLNQSKFDCEEQKETGNLTYKTRSQLDIQFFQEEVSAYYNISLEDVLSKKKTKTIAKVRQIAMYLTKELGCYSLPEIGNAFGGRDHTTVLHALKKVKELRATNAGIYAEIRNLHELISDKISYK